MKLKSKLFAGVLGAAMVLSTVAIPASAQTTAELTAQINSLLAMIAQLQAQIAGTTPGTGASVMFTSDLTIGSTGAEVTALQQWLVSKGYMVMPAGVAYGYFGPLTQSALAKYQAEAGISPAVGYFGPITRAKVNAMAGTPGTPGTPTTPGAGITTPGVEGTLTVTSNNAGLVSTAYEGDSRAPILGMRLEAKTSDIAVQRIKLDLGNSTVIYNKIYSRLHVMDGSNVLASVDLNSSTVVKEGTSYFVTITGFNYVVPRNTTRNLVIAADVYNTVDSGDIGSRTVSLANNGVRGVDGAGIDQYSPQSGFGRAVNVQKSLSTQAALKVSLSGSTPKATTVAATSGVLNNEADKVAVLVFDVKAEKDNITITDLVATTTKTGSGTATATVAYLFDGSTELDNASINSSTGVATFSNIDVEVAKDTTKTLTIKLDIREASTTSVQLQTSVTAVGFTAERSDGATVVPTGSATGELMTVVSKAPVITLTSVSINNQKATDNGVSTSTVTATFNVKLRAVGSDMIFGTQAASSTFNFAIYNGGTATTYAVASSTSFTIPTSGVITSGLATGQAFKLAENNEVTVPVTFIFQDRNASGVQNISTLGAYAVGLQSVNWAAEGESTSSSNFMAGMTEWRTSTVTLP